MLRCGAKDGSKCQGGHNQSGDLFDVGGHDLILSKSWESIAGWSSYHVRFSSDCGLTLFPIPCQNCLRECKSFHRRINFDIMSCTRNRTSDIEITIYETGKRWHAADRRSHVHSLWLVGARSKKEDRLGSYLSSVTVEPWVAFVALTI